MRYFGGKAKVAKQLAAYLESRREGRVFIEPFCGALNITAAMECAGPRLASDASPYLFSLYKALREGWEPPSEVSEELHQQVKARRDPDDPLTAFVGYGCSFGGTFFGTYARGADGRNYALNARNGLEKKLSRCSQVVFACAKYDALRLDARHFVYCDPPYADTAGYAAVGAFDSAAFWQWVRVQSSKGARVLVSEYKAPHDFRCVWEMRAPGDMQGRDKTSGRLERLFEWSGP